MNPFFKKIHSISSDFEEIFFLNEYRSLAGANLRTILALVAIMFFTFLALGFAVGGMENLEKKMSNPYTNWVNIDVTGDINKKSKEIQGEYDKQQVKDSLGLNNMNGFTRYVIDFYEKDYNPFIHSQDTLHRNIWGRTIEPDEPLINNVLGADNVIWKSNGGEMEECDIITTSSLFTSTNFQMPSQKDSLFYIPVKYDFKNIETKEDESFLVYLRVFAIVEEMPGLNNRFMSFPKLHNMYHANLIDGKKCLVLEGNSDSANNYFLLTDMPDQKSKIEGLLQEYFKSSFYLDIENTYSILDKNYYGLRLSFESTASPSIDSIRSFIKTAKGKLHVCEYAFFDCGGDQCEYLEPESYNYLAFHFNKLEYIRKFKKDIFEKFDIEMDLSQVESKENFWLVSRLTLFISLILLAFGILSIVLYVNNVLKNHLFNIQPNLGTFQAFGLKNKFLTKTYLKIILSFLSLSIFVSYSLSIVFDRAEQFWRGEDSMFNIFSPWLAIAMLCLVIVSLVLSNRTINKLLNDTPGNLIYER